MKSAIIIFAKNFQAGRVKTRLARTEGDARALHIYQKLFYHTLDVVTDLPDGVDRYLYYSQYVDETVTSSYPNIQGRVQKGNDLGQRMHYAFTDCGKQYDQIILIGTDCGHLSTTVLSQAYKQLASYDVVIGPTNDGGYYLIGLHQPQELLFKNIIWSTPSVISTAIGRLHAMDLQFYLLPTLRDVDVIEDWEELGWEKE